MSDHIDWLFKGDTSGPWTSDTTFLPKDTVEIVAKLGLTVDEIVYYRTEAIHETRGIILNMMAVRI